MTVAYTLGGQPAAQFVHPLFFALALGAVFLIGRQLGFNRAACFLASTPWRFLFCSGTVPSSRTISPSSPSSCWRSRARLARSSSSTSRLRLGVFFLASSLAIKYTSFFGLPWIALLLLWGLRGRPGKIREVGFWTLIFGVTAVLWQVRAYVFTGNPFFPSSFGQAVGYLHPGLGLGPRLARRSVPGDSLVRAFQRAPGVRISVPKSSGILPAAIPPGLAAAETHGAEPRGHRARRVEPGLLPLVGDPVFPFLRYAGLLVALVFLLACERFEAAFRQGSRGFERSCGAC